MPIKTFRGQIADAGKETIPLHTRNGSTGYIIKKFETISQQNTEQSQLITQRKNNLPPKNFESNEDSLDGFDLSEFEPR